MELSVVGGDDVECFIVVLLNWTKLLTNGKKHPVKTGDAKYFSVIKIYLALVISLPKSMGSDPEKDGSKSGFSSLTFSRLIVRY